MKVNLFPALKVLFFCLGVSACQIPDENIQPVSEAEFLDFASFENKVKIMDRSENSITFEYSDVRIDEVSVLAEQYCQITVGQNAFLDKIILYKNNARRAKFYCYK